MRKGEFRRCALLFPIAFMFFTAPARVVAEPGVLVGHPDNPRYLMVKHDPDRRAVLLTGVEWLLSSRKTAITTDEAVR